MRQLLILAATLPIIVAPAAPANAAIHEMVAAFCSGGGVGVIDANGFLEPPGSGVVVGGVITDKPAAKYPAGTPVPVLNATGPSLSDHPSAEHCANAPP
jgi:hypothetical protein